MSRILEDESKIAKEIADSLTKTVIDRAMEEVQKRVTAMATLPTFAPTLSEAKAKLPQPVKAWLRDIAGMASDDDKAVLRDIGWLGRHEIDVPMNTLSGDLTRATEVGDVVPTQIGQYVAERLSHYDAVRRVARVLPTDRMDKVTLPIFDDTSNSGALVTSEIDMDTSVAPTISSVTLDCHRATSRPVVVDYALLRDAAVDIESVLGDLIAERIGRIANYYETVGTGSSQPTGLLASSGGVPMAKETSSSSTIAWGELLDMVYAIDAAYRGNAVWMMHSSILAAIQKLEDDYGRPLFYPDLTGQSPGRLLGYPVIENASMASSITAGAKVAIFGDFSRFVIREVTSLRMLVLKERYASVDAVGFLAFYYFDSKLQASSNTKSIGHLLIKSGT